MSCPSCFALTFSDAEFCERCGARRERAERPSGDRCPGCRGPLQAVTMGRTTLLECVDCDGLWVDAQSFERICADREAQAAVLHHRSSRPAAANRRVSYRPCVQCGTMMNRINFGRLSGTIVDVCRNHGTFLDAGELQAIVSFVQSGGIERSRQRQIEDLKEQQARLRDQETRLRSARYDSGRQRSGWFDGGTDFISLLFDVFGNDSP